MPPEASRLESAIARRARVPTGEVGAESKRAGAGEEPCPAGAEADRRVVAAEVFIDDPSSDVVVRLRGARGCATGESDSHREGEECRTRERAWQSVTCCGTVSCLETRLSIFILAGKLFPFVAWIVWRTEPGFVDRASFESVKRDTFFFVTSRRCT